MIGLLAVGLLMSGSAALSKPTGIAVDLSVAADGSCQARIGDRIVAVTQDVLPAQLPALIPDKKQPIRLNAGLDIPYRCFGQFIFVAQRLGYASISFAAEPPPLSPEIPYPAVPDQ